MTAPAESDIVQIAITLMALREGEQKRIDKISKYVRGQHDRVYTPRGASHEYRWLARRCNRNFLPLIVSSVSQNLHVDGFRPTGSAVDETWSDSDPEPCWDAFRANRMISRQHGIHRSVIKYGCAYLVVLPGTLGLSEDGLPSSNSMPYCRPVSPKKMTALYADDDNDEWPIYSVEEQLIADSSAAGKARRVITVMDDTNRYIFIMDAKAKPSQLTLAAPGDPILNGKDPIMAHNMGICPVVRFTDEIDLDDEGSSQGFVEPLVEIQDSINFTTFNLMLAEQFAAFRQRWVIGMESSVDESGRPARPWNPGVDRMLASDSPDTKFGEFDVTPLQPYLDVREASIRHMSTISQVPPYHLLGAMVNLSADALTAARDGFDSMVEELQAVLTDPWRNAFRLMAKANKDSDGWEDITSRVLWRDMSARSFSATIDGLGKAAQMLGVPVTELWRKIPGVTADDVNAWIEAVNRKDALAKIDQIWQSAATNAAMANNPTPDEPFQLGSVGEPAVGAPPPVAPGTAPGSGSQAAAPSKPIPDAGRAPRPGPAS